MGHQRPPPAQAHAQPAQAHAHAQELPPPDLKLPPLDVTLGIGFVLFVMVLVKLETLPITPVAKSWTPVTIDPANSEPGKVGILVPPGVGEDVGALIFRGADVPPENGRGL